MLVLFRIDRFFIFQKFMSDPGIDHFKKRNKYKNSPHAIYAFVLFDSHSSWMQVPMAFKNSDKSWLVPKIDLKLR